MFDSLHYNAVANNDIINSGSRGSVNMSETFFFLKFRFGSIWMQKEHFPFLQMIEKMKQELFKVYYIRIMIFSGIKSGSVEITTELIIWYEITVFKNFYSFLPSPGESMRNLIDKHC